ncbi:unnamed protein product [Brugia pahangi]|uniref:Uncharacterized protein n=1 Tax=Brugia pahangi TaxID=6280 RepID=A0A0N4T747_BRUPA|nr:unnamed protein product [Brugia pahangi]
MEFRWDHYTTERFCAFIANGNEPGNGGRERGEWKSWKSGSGGGNWDSWKNSNKPISAKAEAHASASIDP